MSCPYSYLRASAQGDEMHIHCWERTVSGVKIRNEVHERFSGHRGSVLWKMVCFKEHDIPHLNKNNLYHRIRRRHYIKEFKFDTITALSVRRRDRDFIYNLLS